MSKWKHRLTKIDIERKNALCSNCGYVDILKKKRNNGKIGFRCYNAFTQYKYKKRRTVNLPNNILKNNICEICKENKKVVVDHCHNKNSFRGFLCYRCNILLGFAKDDIKILKSAIKYLS